MEGLFVFFAFKEYLYDKIVMKKFKNFDKSNVEDFFVPKISSDRHKIF